MSFQRNSGIVSWNRPWPLPSRSFLIVISVLETEILTVVNMKIACRLGCDAVCSGREAQSFRAVCLGQKSEWHGKCWVETLWHEERKCQKMGNWETNGP
jgi:hypothetical protein